jgi:hypothetical protein
MPGFQKQHRKRNFGRAFPASRYDDPRGRRPSALERNIARYRTAEITLYLHYAEEIRDFMLTDVYRATAVKPGADPWEPSKERRLQNILSRVLSNAEIKKSLKTEDGIALRQAFASERQQGKKLKAAFAHAIKIGIFNETEANELKELLDYRNDIAHRVHEVMSDLNRSYWAADHVAYAAPAYKGGALDRIREYKTSMWNRAGGKLMLSLSMDSMLFELAEDVLEADLKRWDKLIRKQITKERERTKAINAELSLKGTELVGDLAPRFPANHRPSQSYGGDYLPETGHLTKRGVEICYRLFDLGKSPMAVAYIMGMTLRSAERRQRSWLKAGGPQRTRPEVERYDLNFQQRPASPRPNDAVDHPSHAAQAAEAVALGGTE